MSIDNKKEIKKIVQDEIKKQQEAQTKYYFIIFTVTLVIVISVLS